MMIYIYLLIFLILFNLVKTLYKKIALKNPIKKELFSIWKLFFNNIIIMSCYHFLLYKSDFTIPHLTDYFIGIIIFQILFITVFKDILGYIRKSNSGLLFKLLLAFKSDKSKNEIEEIIEYINEGKDEK